MPPPSRYASGAALLSWLALVVALRSGAVARAQEPDEIGFGESAAPASSPDDIGFGSGEVESSAAPVEPSTSESVTTYKLGATLRMQTAYRLAAQLFAKARQLVDVRLDVRHDFGSDVSLRLYAAGHTEVDLYLLANHNAVDPTTFDVYLWNARPREIYLALDWSAFALRIGEQIVNLGQGEILSALDVVNPRDLREPLLTDAEDMRLPVLMTRASVTIDRVRIEAIAVHEPYFGMLAPPLGEFSPLRKLILEDPTLGPALEDRSLRNHPVPAHTLIEPDATQFHARVAWSGPSVDLVLVASDLLDPAGVPTLPPAAEFDRETIEIPIAHPRYALFGHNGAYTLGPILFRWELVYEHRRPVTLQRTDTEFTLWTRDRMSAVRGMFGLTYAPTTQTSLAVEALQTLLLDPPPRDTALLFPLEATQLALRINQSALRERLTFSGVLLWIGVAPFNGFALRVESRYAITDALEVALGLVWYQPTEHFGVFYGFGESERVFLNVRWNVSG